MDRLLQKDLTVRVLSVVLAVILWLQVNADEANLQRKVFEGVQATVQNVPADLAVADPDRLAVRVTLQGPPNVLARLRADDLRPVVNLREARSGIASYQVEVNPPKGMSVVEVSPARLTLRIEPRLTRRVPLFVEAAGEPGNDLQAGAPVVPRSEATVSGAQSLVQQVVSVFGWAHVGGQRTDAKVQVRLLPVDRAGREVAGVSVEPDTIDVMVPIRPAAGAVKPVLPRLSGDPPPGFRVLSATAAPGQVTVRGPADRVAAIGSIETAPVTVVGARASFRQEVDLVVPAGVDALAPKRVTVLVEIGSDVVSRIVDDVPVAAQNQGPGLNARLTPEVVTAVIEGPADRIKALTAADLRLFVDLRNLGPGTHRVQVQGTLPADVRLVETRPRAIEVVIR